ncbi:phosphatase 2C-like domain-containing protein [Nemania sp. FL0031]|nr:phosphatase 2C-like domain-containing protein [Nemania sp. FL0031]
MERLKMIDGNATTMGHEPKITIPWKLDTYKPMTIIEATRELRQHESRVFMSSSKGQTSIQTDINRLASSSPVEDDYAVGLLDVGDQQKWLYWGVYDGHRGWATSKLLSTTLASCVASELGHLSTKDLRDPQKVSVACEVAFKKLDDGLLSDAMDAMDNATSHAEAMCRIAPANAGSCATLVLFDPISSSLHVACVGDSRAVLGHKEPGDESGYTAVALSIDQNGYEKSEIERITAEHPGEQPIDEGSGRILDCAVTRSFGDLWWKWPVDKVEKWYREYFGNPCRSNYHTPPYLTAQPVVKSAKVSKGDFLILASDGFWNHIQSNDDAIHCVKLWLEARQNGELNDKASFAAMSAADGAGLWRSPGGYHWNWQVPRANFLAEDDNAATHLIKNAFGGILRDLFCSAMSIKSTESKEVRDDVTVIVVLF